MKKTQMHFNELPYYLSFFMITDEKNDCVKVEIHSKIHVNKIHEMPHSWSIDYVATRPQSFAEDVFSYAIKVYDLKPNAVTYS